MKLQAGKNMNFKIQEKQQTLKFDLKYCNSKQFLNTFLQRYCSNFAEIASNTAGTLYR